MARKIAYLDKKKLRLYVGNQRIHHGACGAVMALATFRPGAFARAMGLLGLILAAEDAHDWTAWFKRESAPNR